jgi:hypothetical protein
MSLHHQKLDPIYATGYNTATSGVTKYHVEHAYCTERMQRAEHAKKKKKKTKAMRVAAQ